MNGLHLIGDLTGCRCDPQLLLDGAGFRAKCLEMVAASGLTTMDATFHQFEGSGFTGTVVLAESHLAIHTWPEYRYAAVDVFSCGEVLQPQVAADYLVEQFGASRASVVELQRGIFMNHPRPLLHKPAGFEAGLGLPAGPAAHASRSQGATPATTLLSAASHLAEDASGIGPR